MILCELCLRQHKPADFRLRRYDSCFLKWYSESLFFLVIYIAERLTILQNTSEGKVASTLMSAQRCSASIAIVYK